MAWEELRFRGSWREGRLERLPSNSEGMKVRVRERAAALMRLSWGAPEMVEMTMSVPWRAYDRLLWLL